MFRLDLDGSWTLRCPEMEKSFAATVPGDVYMALLEAGEIADPFWAENELDCLWVGERDWEFERSFEVEQELLNQDHVELVFEGLDTLATVELNGQEILSCDNMFREYRVSAKEALRSGVNKIVVKFRSVLPLMRERDAARHLRTISCVPWEPAGRPYVRKEQCNFGWDWGPVVTTAGVWRPVRLEAWSDSRIEDVWVRQQHDRSGDSPFVRLALQVSLRPGERASEQSLRFSLSRSGSEIIRGQLPVESGSTVVHCGLDVEDAVLWWPNGMGDQSLYTLRVDLLQEAEGGRILQSWTHRIGLCELELITEDDEWGQSFCFACNGVRFFAKGANWIPADALYNRTTEEDLRHLLGSAAAANMNMIRVWGGGVYESDAFYRICDELGLTVWQDFMFACAAYPADDDSFLENVRAEAIHQVRRLRNHCSIALWCGNNELEMHALEGGWPNMPMDLYEKMFDRLLGEVVRDEDPGRRYWPSSSHSPQGNRLDANNPNSGDAHLWEVWHGLAPFERYRSDMHRFCSEFGFQSYPEPRTIVAYTEPDQRNITHPVMEHHQRSKNGNPRILHYMLSWFRMPEGFAHTVWLSQIQHGLAMQYAVEHWRRHQPRCMGALYWQLNDCWPVASWASIDYFGRWKALQYFARRFFRPQLLSIREDETPGSGKAELHLTLDPGHVVPVEIEYRLTDTAGNALVVDRFAYEPSEAGSRCVAELDFADFIIRDGARKLMLWADLIIEDQVRHEAFTGWNKPKGLEIEDPDISFDVQEGDDGEIEVVLRCERPALWAWLEIEGMDLIWSDNFFCMRPGRDYIVRAMSGEASALRMEDLAERLVVKSVWDTF